MGAESNEGGKEMILADKIIRLRKKNGWSQEELAEKMNVSRQAVAKWEGAQTIPSMEKILQLGELFGVTLDYLLKDERETEENTGVAVETSVRRVTLTEANEFLAWRERASIRIAVGVFLCILAVAPLLLLAAWAEYSPGGISEELAGVGGLMILLMMVAAAVAIFIFCGFENRSYEFLDKEFFETEYGVRGMVQQRQKEYKTTYARCNVIGACICILSPIPLFLGALLKNQFYMMVLLAITFLLVDIGVMFFLVPGVRWASMEKLLQQGDFQPEEKEKNRTMESISGFYWTIVTVVYLAWSFVTGRWGSTWIIWPVAGVLFAGLRMLLDLLPSQRRR